MRLRRPYQRIFKPILDVVLAFLLVVLLSPVFVIISTVLMLLRQPVLFRQTRPGLHGKAFIIYKFTSMHHGNEHLSFPFGKFIRRTSLDELPQLFNILKGEMSFIGPRPLLTEYLKIYTPEQSKRHLVRPGITGWAQVHGRNALSLDQKTEFDLYYVSHLSMYLDLQIAVSTLLQVIRWKEADYHDNPDSLLVSEKYAQGATL